MSDHDPVTVEPAAFDSPDGRRLVAEAVDELRLRYGVTDEDLGHRIPVAADFAGPRAVFLVARVGPRAVGCVGLRPMELGGEVKRLYVEPDHRGWGVGRRLMGELERRARRAGHRVLFLETGEAQPEAIALYEATGWRRIAGWPGNPVHHGSVYFDKDLGPAGGG